MNARIERLEKRIARVTGRYDAIAEHCGVDPLPKPGDNTKPGDSEKPVDDGKPGKPSKG